MPLRRPTEAGQMRVVSLCLKGHGCLRGRKRKRFSQILSTWCIKENVQADRDKRNRYSAQKRRNPKFISSRNLVA